MDDDGKWYPPPPVLRAKHFRLEYDHGEPRVVGYDNGSTPCKLCDMSIEQAVEQMNDTMEMVDALHAKIDRLQDQIMDEWDVDDD